MSAPRILFIGNSYTQRSDLPGMLAHLVAVGEGTEWVHERVIANGASLRQHWNAGTAPRLIREQPWDWVVLQEQSTLPVKNAARYHENVRLFASLVREHDAGLVLYLPWARQAALSTQADLNRAVSAIAAETGATVAPVGPAWERLREAGDAPELYDRDGSHPTPAGTYVAACVFYATLCRRSPESLPPPPSLRLPPETATRIGRIASAVALDDPAWR